MAEAVTYSFQTPVYKLVYPVDNYADALGKMLSLTVWNGKESVSLVASCQSDEAFVKAKCHCIGVSFYQF